MSEHELECELFLLLPGKPREIPVAKLARHVGVSRREGAREGRLQIQGLRVLAAHARVLEEEERVREHLSRIAINYRLQPRDVGLARLVEGLVAAR